MSKAATPTQATPEGSTFRRTPAGLFLPESPFRRDPEDRHAPDDSPASRDRAGADTITAGDILLDAGIVVGL